MVISLGEIEVRRPRRAPARVRVTFPGAGSRTHHLPKESHPDLVGRLAGLPAFAVVPRRELEWLSARGEVRKYEAGETILAVGEAIDEMFILLDGRVSLSMARGSGWRTIMVDGATDVMGAVPYSRGRVAPGSLVAVEAATLFVLHRSRFDALVRECPELTAVLVHLMLDRARDLNTLQLNDDRMQALGRLAAGLAHELNNPAAGAARAAEALATLLAEAELASRALAAARLDDDQLQAIDELRLACATPPVERSPLEEADREQAIADWLHSHGLETTAAESLVLSDVSLSQLERIAGTDLSADTLETALRWIACGLAAREAAHEVELATQRIHTLVSAVKGFTFMDRHDVPDEVDIARGLADTITILETKARARSVQLRLETPLDLPRVYGFGVEINQIWEKLINNAIDASPSDATVVVTATTDDRSVSVCVTDSGTGIPGENRTRIFDPFFTTKPVGQGSGLGLSLARRIVEMHGGEIDFSSQPGETRFCVRLPVDRVPTAADLPQRAEAGSTS